MPNDSPHWEPAAQKQMFVCNCHRLDLAFLEKDEWTVVDFKTDRELEIELERYKRQVALYALSIEQATGQARARILMKI